MSELFLIGDTHWDHANILKFKRDDGTPLRPFNSIHDMNMIMVENWNSVVNPKDKIYHMGDVAFTKTGLNFLKLCNGHKRLVRGNHDLFKITEYLEFFEEVYGVRQIDGYWMTHVPMHIDSINRAKANIHGHLHYNIIDHPKYFNVSVERINYTPISFDLIKKQYDFLSS